MAPRPILGKLLLALGVIGMIRLVPEILQASRVSRMFQIILTVDAILAMATAAVGEGLWHGKAWAPRLALRTAGVVLSTSVAVVVLEVWQFTQVKGVIYSVHVHPTVWGRLLYYAMTVVLWPYAVRTLIIAAPAEARGSMLRTFLLWLVLGIPLVLVVLAVFR